MKSIWITAFGLLFALGATGAVPYDFDGDGKTDFGIHRNVAGDAGTSLKQWWVRRSSDGGLIFQQFGYAVTGVEIDRPFAEDYDGDGKTDFAVVRFSQSDPQTYFFILNSASNTVRIEAFGLGSDDFTVIGDYDGDAKADLAVYRKPSVAGQGSLFIYKGSLTGNVTFAQFGNGSMNPLKGDFDGDGKADFCVRDTTGLIYLKRSGDGGVEYIRFGLSTDTAYTGDHDGDHKTDFFMVRQNGSNYEWYVLERDGGGTGGSPIVWGLTVSSGTFDQIFVAGDYDGDGRYDIGVYRPVAGSPNVFYIRRSSDGGLIAQSWGASALGDNTYYVR